MSEKEQIQKWQEKIRQDFGDQERLYEYLFQTMDNFYYRYLETSLNQGLSTTQQNPTTWGAISYESNLMDILKIQNPELKKKLIEFAKNAPKETTSPKVQYSLIAHIIELTSDHGEIEFIAQVNWDMPEFKAKDNSQSKRVLFKYNDLGDFRKHLALKLEEACELFL